MAKLRRIGSGLVLGLALLAPASAGAAEHAAPADSAGYAEELQGFVPGAAVLEGRIRAPCCWNQTIDIHGSEVSNDLRREIRKRLKAGESPDAIEASIVTRYGPKILAVPPGSPLKNVAAALAVAMIGAGVLGFRMLKRWRRPAQPPEKPNRKAPEAAAGDAQLDARLDAELRALDD
ncbi:MAG TPA: cytochrome c-type biogenesis protein CcmH [Polyangiaceae bacterium]